MKKTLGHREILKGISFDVQVGDIFGYLGPNGAGKTTTIRILLGLLRADSGSVSILGADIDDTATRMKIGFALDPDGLYDAMTAAENLEYYAQIYDVKDTAARIEKVLGLVGMAERAGDRVGTFSRGMRQRLSLARAMVHNPEVLILDEPTAGVDPSGQIEIRKILLDIAREEKKTVLFSSHNLDEVQRICNRIALIDRGEIKLYGELEELRRKMGKSGVTIEIAGAVPENVFGELKEKPRFGFREMSEKSLIFEPDEGGASVGDIVNFLVARGVMIEKVGKSEASLEELYTAILEEVEQ
ncbi:MAG TPA: ABC transporter ATP-binding protein [Candidatus Bipolaricaulis sp.]|nr:ABC transporter ATP-binding protein [Candidatus Bipolaricaulis sp.]HRS14085.1 ABC transporter ATP-binding protein [Candidatus Bipolaricaulis sp.]HRU21842.1 ABC transporter ATP-binding protein [Candidatus Bipolaricaulis sp.]